MPGISRRSVLQTMALSGAAAAAGTGIASAATSPRPREIERFGIAAPGVGLDAFIRSEGFGYLVTRSSTPTRLGEYDFATGKITRHVEVPSGLGGWAATVSAGYVYIGMYDNGSVHRFNQADGTISSVGRLGSATYVWDMTTAPDGTIYAGTYPDGKVWEITPETGNYTELGAPVPNGTYCRYVGADDTTVVAAINTPGGHVMAIDRATGAATDITPSETGTDVGYGPLRMGGGRVYVNGGGKLIDMRPDGTDVQYITLPDGTRSTDHISVQPDGTVYLTVLPSATVYRYRTGDAELTEIATPSPGDGTRCVSQLDDTTLFGATWTGTVWYVNLADGSVELVELTDVGMPVAAQRPHSITAIAPGGTDDATIFVASSGRVHVHRPWQDEYRKVFMPGEPKTMLTMDGKVYGAIYPSTEVFELDPATDKLRSLGTIGNQQYRPSYIAHDSATDLLVVGSGPGFNEFTGAVTLADRQTGELDVHREVLPDQAIRALTVADGVAYVGGDVWGEGSQRGPAEHASLAAFDLATREVLWRTDPMPGQESTWGLGILDGVLYAVMSREYGVWFAYDIAAQQVIHDGTLSGHGRVFVQQGNVFATVYGGGNIYRLGPDLGEAQLVVEDLGELWYGGPSFAPEDTGSYGWGLSQGDLARINTSPA